jgi:hypothetical protein
MNTAVGRVLGTVVGAVMAAAGCCCAFSVAAVDGEGHCAGQATPAPPW